MGVLNQIGSFSFIELAGNPEKVKTQVGVMVRAGVDGVTLIDDAARGTPFMLRSKIDVRSMDDGRSLYSSYCGLIGANPVAITWQGVDLSNYFAVLGVTQAVLKAIVTGTGGLRPPSLAWLECDWQLIAINN